VVVPCSLTCNPTRTPPNQVSYLKGSSMESFTLGLTPKIGFSYSTTTANLQCLKREQISSNNLTKYLSKLWWNSIPNSCSSQCPGASIYRLRVQMGDCCDKYGSRPDGEPEPFERTIVRQKIMRFSLKIFPVWEPRLNGRHCHLDDRTSSASNFHIMLHASGPRGMAVRMVDPQHAISISV
jgi:hypothetical protein